MIDLNTHNVYISKIYNTPDCLSIYREYNPPHKILSIQAFPKWSSWDYKVMVEGEKFHLKVMAKDLIISSRTIRLK